MTILLAGCAVGIFGGRKPRFADDFARYAETTQLSDGDSFGPWSVAFGGYGAVRLTDGSLELVPRQARDSAATHAALVTGPAFAGAIDFRVRVFTGAQLRVGTPPNPWEAAWIMWAFLDADHSYYFLPKPNGWELAKRDPAYPGGQRMLATGDAPVFRVNRWYGVRVVHRAPTITVYVDGERIATFTDEERPYPGGRIALYSEDAAVRFDDVWVD